MISNRRAAGAKEEIMKKFFTSESVTEGHPDKVCDQISDAVLDAVLEHDANARVAIECCATTGMVLVMGGIALEKGFLRKREKRQA